MHARISQFLQLSNLKLEPCRLDRAVDEDKLIFVDVSESCVCGCVLSDASGILGDCWHGHALYSSFCVGNLNPMNVNAQ